MARIAWQNALLGVKQRLFGPDQRRAGALYLHVIDNEFINYVYLRISITLACLYDPSRGSPLSDKALMIELVFPIAVKCSENYGDFSAKKYFF